MTSCTVPIAHASDVAQAARLARLLALQLGFDLPASHQVELATLELASNVLRHGGGGSLAMRPLAQGGIELLASDTGPGIADVVQAFQEGYSSAGSLGCGLSGVARLMDEVVIDSVAGAGTRIRACKRR